MMARRQTGNLDMSEHDWAFVDRVCHYLHLLEADMMQQRVRLEGFAIDTDGGSVTLRVRITPVLPDAVKEWEEA